MRIAMSSMVYSENLRFLNALKDYIKEDCEIYLELRDRFYLVIKRKEDSFDNLLKNIFDNEGEHND